MHYNSRKNVAIFLTILRCSSNLLPIVRDVAGNAEFDTPCQLNPTHPDPPPTQERPSMAAKDPPDIRRAWNYFYGRSLPRREVEEDNDFNAPVSWRKLEPVEPGGELYPLSTPMRELG